jgi:hypothetical protein
MKRPRLRLRGLLERRATLGGMWRRICGPSASVLYREFRRAPCEPRPGVRPWLQGALTIGAPAAAVK